jgi:hypothetical protein
MQQDTIPSQLFPDDAEQKVSKREQAKEGAGRLWVKVVWWAVACVALGALISKWLR